MLIEGLKYGDVVCLWVPMISEIITDLSAWICAICGKYYAAPRALAPAIHLALIIEFAMDSLIYSQQFLLTFQ